MEVRDQRKEEGSGEVRRKEEGRGEVEREEYQGQFLTPQRGWGI